LVDETLSAYFAQNPEAVVLNVLPEASSIVQALRKEGTQLVVPLMSQNDLIGLLKLGPRRSGQEYSLDDRHLLTTLASQVAPAIQVAQLVLERQTEALERERVEQELRVAQRIQQTLLPKEIPIPAGWRIAAYYQPAREVGGDFYDFFSFADGRFGLVIGDVTGKGIPAALVMTMIRSILHAIIQADTSPGAVLEQANNTLHPDIPPGMFVTCFYAVIDPHTGVARYANAGHDLPYRYSQGRASELHARGMPLGLMPDMLYEEQTTTLLPGESVLLYSDGIVEAHNPTHDMFGFPRLMSLLAEYANDTDTHQFLLDHLHSFTGVDWIQEDDITLCTIQHISNDLYQNNH
jgi:serine phosphatase RsbU (regulator of sigma subunit)